MPLLVYIIGEPGAGKTTLMEGLTARWTRIAYFRPPFARDWLVEPKGLGCDLIGVEIGRRRPGGFSGTDALGQTVIESVVPWLPDHDHAPIVFAEGARLANMRFFRHAFDEGFDLILGHLRHNDAAVWREQRQVILGRRPQNPSWVRGRRTASLNLAAELATYAGVTVLTGHPDELLWPMNKMIEEHLCQR